MKFDIALCTDEKFVIPALTCLTSIFENNSDNVCSITILTAGISFRAISKFNQLAAYYKSNITIRKIDGSCFNNLITIDRYPLSMYFRFLLPYMLPDKDRVLYLDCDIIVRHSLKGLFDTDIQDKACAVVMDQQCDNVQTINRLRISSPYFNSGVMLLNLAYWRSHNISTKLVRFLKDNVDKCIYPDQDALNVVLEGKVVYLSYTYNLQEMWLTMRDSVHFHYSRWYELDAIIQDPVIVHYCVGDKPWYKECKNPFRYEFLKYARLHSFVGFKLIKKYRYLYHLIVAWEMRLHRWSQKFIN